MVLPVREFRGQGNVGPFFYYEFVLKERGSFTILHAHELDHLSIADKPVGVYYISKEDGVAKVDTVGIFDMRNIEAHTHHLFFAYEPNTTCRCIFSKTQGALIGSSINREPYTESCDPALLPEIVKRDIEEYVRASSLQACSGV